MQTATQELPSKKDLLNKVIDCICIDNYLSTHLPYPIEVDISSFLEDALKKIS